VGAGEGHAPAWGGAQDLELVCVERHTRVLIATLGACLLTDHESGEGEGAWTSSSPSAGCRGHVRHGVRSGT